MKKDQVRIGGVYAAKVSGQLARVRIDRESRHGGWNATNVLTHRQVRIKSAQRLRREVASEKPAEPVAAETAAVQDDRPPQDIDERIAAAPPSIVPYEKRRARAEAAQVEAADDAPRYDPPLTCRAGLRPAVAEQPVTRSVTRHVKGPSRCATPRCKGAPVMTYLERQLCQACWDRHCEEEQPSEVSDSAGDACLRRQACRSNDGPQTPEEENDMSKKKSTKKQSTKKPAKAQTVTAKAKGGKKAAAPKAKATTENKPKRVSALDAAAQVLATAGKPMRAQELITAMAEQNLWKSPAGATPHATLYAAMMREARDKGGASRFLKVDRGQFAFNKEAK